MNTWFLSVLVLLSCSCPSDASERALDVQPAVAPRFLDVPVSTDHVTPADRSSMELHKVNATSVEWVMPITVDLTALEQDTIEAFLFNKHVVIRRKPARRPPTGNVVHWHGEVALPGDVEGRITWGLGTSTYSSETQRFLALSASTRSSTY